jgi:hypothetical protein
MIVRAVGLAYGVEFLVQRLALLVGQNGAPIHHQQEVACRSIALRTWAPKRADVETIQRRGQLSAAPR